MGRAGLDADLGKADHPFGEGSVVTVHVGTQFGLVAILFPNLTDLATHRDGDPPRFPLTNERRQVGAHLVVVSLLLVHCGIT